MSFNGRILPLTVAAALFMEQMDSTIIATSLPAIAQDLDTSPISLKLAFTTYLLGLTVFLPISGWLADRFGAKRIFTLAIVVFTMASFACGFAQSLEHLIIARGLQGVGGALMVPVGRIIILRSVQKSELLDAIAWLTIPALIGPVIGPPIGGYITTVYDWRWIFWMNLPFGVLALSLALWLMPNVETDAVPPLDVKGFLLTGFGLTLAVLGMTLAGQGVLPGWQVTTMITSGLLLLAAYFFYAQKAANPILDLRVMRMPTFRYSVLGGNLYRIAVGASPFLLPLLLQIGFGLSALDTGLITFASAVGALLMKFTVKPLVQAFGYRSILLFNGVAACALMIAKGFFEVSTPYVVMFGVLLLSGFSRSLQFSSLNTMAYADIESRDIAKANALYTVLQQLFLAIGVALAAFVLEARLWWGGRTDLVADDFTFALILLSIVSAFSLLFYLKLTPNAGASISGRASED
jgi:EmrB/QacA subfamily drug resistance transporter